MKNIDEAIKHAEEKAKELYCKADEDFFFDGDWGKKIHCTECAKEHEQLANWLKELKMHSWNPIKTEKISEAEKKELAERYGMSPEEFDDFWRYACKMPEDNQECLITTSVWGYVCIDTFHIDEDGAMYFEDHEDEDDVLAWMPLPEPYKEDEHDGNF